MFIGYDVRIHGSGPVPEPAKVYSDRFERCAGCPYPRHGLFCRNDNETCLRTEVAELKSQQRRPEVVPV